MKHFIAQTDLICGHCGNEVPNGDHYFILGYSVSTNGQRSEESMCSNCMEEIQTRLELLNGEI